MDNLESHFSPCAGCHKLKAVVGYNHELEDERVGSGGVCIWVNFKFKHLVLASKHSCSQRLQWIRLSDIT